MMNSSVSDDLTRDFLAFETASCLKNISTNTKNITSLHKELLEINLSVITYVEESKKRLAGLRAQLCHEAKTSHRVVEILSNNYEAILEWFGRTVKTRKKIAAFLNNVVQESQHQISTAETIEKIQWRQERQQRKDDSALTSPIHSPELIISKLGKRRHSHVRCLSPQWAEGCQPDDEANGSAKKKIKNEQTNAESKLKNNRTSDGDGFQISCNGDSSHGKGKCVLVTPPNIELGQGDCHPSTSGAYSDRSHEALNAQLPRLAVECNGYIEFPKTKNSRVPSPVLNWERKCKVQISYSDDPLNIGEYIIWAVRYYDENKCRRNLLEEFEKLSKEEES